jgi:hypothetical protein
MMPLIPIIQWVHSQTWVPLADKIEALVAVLLEETRLAVFDFALTLLGL